MTKNKFYTVLALICFLGVLAPRMSAQNALSSVSRSTDLSLDLSALPEAPSPHVATDGQTKPNSAPQSNEKFLGIFPVLNSYSADMQLPPQTSKEKLVFGLKTAFGPTEFVITAAEAGYGQATNRYPEFHQGAAGYGRYFWHQYADQADENLMVISFLPIITHEDSRYYRLGHGNVLKRAGYAFSRTLVTRSDGGGETFNASEIVGAGAAAGISDLYYPGRYRTWTKTGHRWLSNGVADGLAYLFDEFWPDVDHSLFHKSN